MNHRSLSASLALTLALVSGLALKPQSAPPAPVVAAAAHAPGFDAPDGFVPAVSLAR